MSIGNLKKAKSRHLGAPKALAGGHLQRVLCACFLETKK